MPSQISVTVVDNSQVGEARRAAVRLAETAKMSSTKVGEVAIVATELATNLWRYGQDGRLLLQVLTLATGPSLELVAIDSGPGMTDLANCMKDGVSSGGTAGTGLGAVRRLSAEFDVYSTPGKGTVVMSRIRAADAPAGDRPRLTMGAVSIPLASEVVCGDTWRVSEGEGGIAVMVADGLGHGPEAAEAAERAGATFDEDPFAAFDQFFPRAHRALTGSRGAAVACAHITRDGAVHYGGIGNISGALLGPDVRRGMPTQNGTVGVEIRKVLPPAVYDWPDRGRLVMHSDGLTGRWTFDTYPGLLVRHPAVVAAVLYRDFLRGRDDATVVVVGIAAAA